MLKSLLVRFWPPDKKAPASANFPIPLGEVFPPQPYPKHYLESPVIALGTMTFVYSQGQSFLGQI